MDTDESLTRIVETKTISSYNLYKWITIGFLIIIIIFNIIGMIVLFSWSTFWIYLVDIILICVIFYFYYFNHINF